MQKFLARTSFVFIALGLSLFVTIKLSTEPWKETLLNHDKQEKIVSLESRKMPGQYQLTEDNKPAYEVIEAQFYLTDFLSFFTRYYCHIFFLAFAWFYLIFDFLLYPQGKLCRWIRNELLAFHYFPKVAAGMTAMTFLTGLLALNF